jgi:hypothetical protein
MSPSSLGSAWARGSALLPGGATAHAACQHRPSPGPTVPPGHCAPAYDHDGTSMVNVTVSEGECQAERAPTRLLLGWLVLAGGYRPAPNEIFCLTMAATRPRPATCSSPTPRHKPARGQSTVTRSLGEVREFPRDRAWLWLSASVAGWRLPARPRARAAGVPGTGGSPRSSL